MKQETLTFPLKDKKGRGFVNPLNDREKKWIKDNIRTYTVIQMCKMLERTGKYIYDYLDEVGLTPLTRNINKVYRDPKDMPKEGCFDENEYLKNNFI